MSSTMEEPDNFDDLLAESVDDLDVVIPDPAPADEIPEAEEPVPAPVEKPKRTRAPRAPKEPVMTAEQQRIADLEAALLALDTEEEVTELTPDQIRIAELEAKLAERVQAKTSGDAPVVYRDSAGDGEKILFHFLESGISALGQVWEKGQEVEIVVGSPEYKRTLNRNGESWIDLLDDEDGQWNRWGRLMIRRGPYRWRAGEEFDLEVAKADARRQRRVPVSAV